MQTFLTKVVISVAVSVAATYAVNYVNKRTGRDHIYTTITYLKF